MKLTHFLSSIRSRLPDLAALVAVSGLTLVFFRQLVFTNQILPRGDVFSYFYPYWHLRNEALISGRIPLWNPYLFMGVPFLANSQAGVLYPPNWPLAFLDAPQGVKVAIVSHLIWAGWGAYFLARSSLKIRPRDAFATSVVFALGGYMTAQVEHVNQIQGLAWLPWILWSFQSAQRNPKRILWLGIAIAMQFLAGHTQSTFITLVTLGMWAAVITLRSWFTARSRSNGSGTKPKLLIQPARQTFGTIVLGGLIALGLSAPQLLPTLELAQQSNRSGGLPFREAVSFSLRPEYVGKAFLPSYGDTALFSEYVAFIGILALIFVLLTVWIHRKANEIKVLTALCAVGVFFALGAFNPLYWMLVRFVPGFDLFRAPARWLVLWSLGSSLIVGYGLDRLAHSDIPQSLRQSLRSLWPMVVIAVLIGLSFLAGVSREPLPGAAPPGGREVAIWVGSLIATGVLLVGTTRINTLARYRSLLIIGLITLEIYVGGRNLPFNHLSSPTAWTSQRPSVSTLLAEQGTRGPIDRFLSISDTVFDPGDIRELNAIYSPYLNETGMSDLLTATKQQEIVAPNLSMRWGLAAADGFDGGLLPLRDYNTFTRMFVSDDNLTQDGRLRENLARVPDLTWLRAMSVRWIVTDKVFDLWQDGVYYDLQFSTAVGSDEDFAIGVPQYFEGTTIGLVGHLEEAELSSDGDPIGYVIVADDSGFTEVLAIRTGTDLSEGVFSEDTRHHQAQVAGSFDPERADLTEYVARIPLGQPVNVQTITVVGAESLTGQLVLRGATLIDERTGAFLPLNVSSGNAVERIYSGDVKIYEYTQTRPRFYLTCNVAFVDSQQAALDLVRDNSESILAIERPGGIDPTCTESLQDRLFVREISPEQYEFNVRVGSTGAYLAINDSWYPGWTAHVFDSYPSRDWREVPIYRANGMFRAIYLPPGTVGVQLRYPGDLFYTGAIISVTSLLITIVLLILPWREHKDDVVSSPDQPASS